MKKMLFVGALIFSTHIFAVTRYEKLISEMNALKNENPHFVEIFSIGKNNAGMDILALRLSDTPKTSDLAKIAYLTVGVHHGNEGGAVGIIMDYSKKVLSKLQTVPSYAKDHEFVMVPVVNITGYNSNSRTEGGIDPNRDYPGPCKGNLPNYRLKSTKAISDLASSREFAASVTIHGYIGTITYPWGVSTSDPRTNDHGYFEEIGSKLGNLTGYRFGTSTDVVYPCEGAFEDWAYWQKGQWSLLFEIKNDSAFEREKNVQALDYFFTDVKSSPSVDSSLKSGCEKRLRSLDRGDE